MGLEGIKIVALVVCFTCLLHCTLSLQVPIQVPIKVSTQVQEAYYPSDCQKQEIEDAILQVLPLIEIECIAPPHAVDNNSCHVSLCYFFCKDLFSADKDCILPCKYLCNKIN